MSSLVAGTLFALLTTFSTASLTLVPLKDRYPDAVCMDGSSSGYYWKAATSEEGNATWIVYLQSGGWCWDAESCAERCEGSPHLCSSDTWETTLNETGLFSDVAGRSSTALQTANKVFVGYCTSDAHMGNAEAFGHQFRGARVVQAVLSDLVNNHGLGGDARGDKQLLLFGGGSAGSRGAMIHLDYVPAMLGEASENVNVVGFLDSPLWLDMKPLNETFFEGFANQTRHVHDFANVTHLGEDCVATFNGSEWKCMLGEYRMHFVETRYFLIASLHDGFQLYFDTGHDGNWTEEQLDYASRFAKRTADLMKVLASMRHAVYAPACHSHAETMTDHGFFDHATDDGTSVCDAVAVFLGLDSNSSDGSNISSTNVTLQWVDHCYSLDCGANCHRGDDLEENFATPDGEILLSWARGSSTPGFLAVSMVFLTWLLK